MVKTRVIGGATLSLGPHAAFEGNVTYQYDETYDTRNLYALNVILHLFFEANHKKRGAIQDRPKENDN